MFTDKNNNYRLKIGFDFDGTLSDGLFVALVKHLILKGHDVWIMTWHCNPICKAGGIAVNI
jgi:hypothetical protein